MWSNLDSVAQLKNPHPKIMDPPPLKHLCQDLGGNLDINAICHALGQTKSLALPFLHCFTRCDTTSGFFSKGKKLSREAWKCYPDVTTAFTHMALNPYIELDTDSQYFHLLGRYTVVLYDKTPSTQGALLQHLNRAAYQAVFGAPHNYQIRKGLLQESWSWDDKI